MTGYENLGPNVSQSPQAVAPSAGQFSAEDRSYEKVVFQQNRPPLDWEWNLMQDALRASSRIPGPSGFLSGDFLSSDLPGAGTGSSLVFLAPDPGGLSSNSSS
jgi:hypothetical protein